jgi:hypothetical protein
MTETVEYPVLDCPPRPRQQVIALVRINGTLKTFVRFRGTPQKGHYDSAKLRDVPRFLWFVFQRWPRQLHSQIEAAYGSCFFPAQTRIPQG